MINKNSTCFFLSTIGIMSLMLFSSCEKESCTSCIAQSKIDKTIVENRVECDKSESFLAGFRDGFESNYREKRDEIEVICD